MLIMYKLVSVIPLVLSYFSLAEKLVFSFSVGIQDILVTLIQYIETIELDRFLATLMNLSP